MERKVVLNKMTKIYDEHYSDFLYNSFYCLDMIYSDDDASENDWEVFLYVPALNQTYHYGFICITHKKPYKKEIMTIKDFMDFRREPTSYVIPINHRNFVDLNDEDYQTLADELNIWYENLTNDNI